MTGSVENTNPEATTEAQAAPPERLALPPPRAPVPEPRPGLLDRLISIIEMRPIAATVSLFALSLGLHILIQNLGGAMSGLLIDKTAFFLTAIGSRDVLLLVLIAYCLVLPTFLARACLTSFADSAGALSCNDRVYDDHLNLLASPFVMPRLVFGFFWAAVLTTVFGSLMQSSIPAAATNVALLTFWMYVRLAVLFGLVGSSLAYLAVLHYQLSNALNAHLRVDLFEMSPVSPLARYIRYATLFLSLPLVTIGPIVSRPEAATASATLLGFGIICVLIASFGSMWGARKAVRAAKILALTELQAYSREIWRRAYANGRIVEAVALPAMAAMLTIRNQIGRMSNWPGGWSNVARCIAISVLPVITWFGPQIVNFLIQPFLI